MKIDRIIDRMAADPFMGAWISEDKLYRYALWRVWERAAYKLVVCMLNPSTADGDEDDPTIRRLVGFAKRDGYGGLLVINLCAFRATEPKALKTAGDAFGPLNEFVLVQAATMAAEAETPILVGWGATWVNPQFVIGHFHARGARLVCLGLTNAGQPRHPLYVRGEQPMVAFG